MIGSAARQSYRSICATALGPLPTTSGLPRDRSRCEIEFKQRSALKVIECQIWSTAMPKVSTFYPARSFKQINHSVTWLSPDQQREGD